MVPDVYIGNRPVPSALAAKTCSPKPAERHIQKIPTVQLSFCDPVAGREFALGYVVIPVHLSQCGARVYACLATVVRWIRLSAQGEIYLGLPSGKINSCWVYLCDPATGSKSSPSVALS